MRGLRPFFGYYGGKWAMAGRLYPAPRFPVVVEPFAGSAGYSLRHHERRVVLYDVDEVVVGVWRYLLRVTPEEIRGIPDVAPGQSVEDLKLCQEARWLVGFWLNRAVAAPVKTPSRWMREHPEYAGSFWGARVRQTIASQLEQIRHWRVVHGAYQDCDIEGPATWFVDPPYQVAGRYYRHGASGIDYAHLGEWCRKRRGQVMVCENAGATWLEFRRLTEVKTTRAGRRSAEVWWTSGEVQGELFVEAAKGTPYAAPIDEG